MVVTSNISTKSNLFCGPYMINSLDLKKQKSNIFGHG